MNTLAVTVYIAELTLDANRYRDAKMKAMKSVKLIEEKHRNDLQRHVTNVKQARNILDQVDVRFVSPSTGGIEKRCRDKDVTGLAVAVEQAMSNYERLNYESIPSGAYAATRTVTGSAAATGASDESGDTDGDSGSDALNEDCQLPEVVTKSVKTMSRWEKQAKLAADRFLIDSSLGQFNVRKYVPQPLTVSHTETGGRRRVEKGLLLVPRPDALPDARRSVGLWRQG